MTWGKVDDQFHAHRKAKRAWNSCRASLGLHLLALSYSAGQLTDGLVDHEFVTEKLPVARERKQAVDALVTAGLWVAEGPDWRINDWLDYNPSREDVLAKRARDAARKARGRGAESTESPNGVPTDSTRSPRGVRKPSRAGAPSRSPAVPDPTNPTPPLPPAGGRERDHLDYEGELAEFSATHFPGVPVDHVKWCADSLRAGNVEPTPEAMRPLIERHYPVEAPTS